MSTPTSTIVDSSFPSDVQSFLTSIENIVSDCWGLTYKSIVHPYEGGTGGVGPTTSAAAVSSLPPTFAGAAKPTLGSRKRTVTESTTTESARGTGGKEEEEAMQQRLRHLYQENLELLLQVSIGEDMLVHSHDAATLASSKQPEEQTYVSEPHHLFTASPLSISSTLLVAALSEAFTVLDKGNGDAVAATASTMVPLSTHAAGTEEVARLTCQYLFDPLLQKTDENSTTETLPPKPQRHSRETQTEHTSTVWPLDVYECIASNNAHSDLLASVLLPWSPPFHPYPPPEEERAAPSPQRAPVTAAERRQEQHAQLDEKLKQVEDKGVGKVVRRAMEMHHALSIVVDSAVEAASSRVRSAASTAASKVEAMMAGPRLQSVDRSPTMATLHRVLGQLQGTTNEDDENRWDQHPSRGALSVRLLEAFCHYPAPLSRDDFRPFEGDAVEIEDVILGLYPVAVPMAEPVPLPGLEEDADLMILQRPRVLTHGWLFVFQSGAVTLLQATAAFYHWRQQSVAVSMEDMAALRGPLLSLEVVLPGTRKHSRLFGSSARITLGVDLESTFPVPGVGQMGRLPPPLLGPPPTCSIEDILEQHQVQFRQKRTAVPNNARAMFPVYDLELAQEHFHRTLSIMRPKLEEASVFPSQHHNASSRLDLEYLFVFFSDTEYTCALQLLWAASHPSGRTQPFSPLAVLDTALPNRNAAKTEENKVRLMRDAAKDTRHPFHLVKNLIAPPTTNTRLALLQSVPATSPSGSMTIYASITRTHQGVGFAVPHRPVLGEWYPTSHALSAEEVCFCEAWHLHPRLYLEAKIELTLRPDRPHFSVMECAALMPPSFSEMVNFTTAEALLAFFVRQGFCEEVELIERLPCPSV